tara:strand:+ start:304 stop:1335 length:1032 start_codon:yes stop_codon:yes gene_type:complete
MQPSLYSLKVTQVDPQAAGVVETPACPVCENTSAVPTFSIEGFTQQVVNCSRCGLGSQSPLPSEEEIRTFYPHEYYGDSGEKFRTFVETMIRLVAARQARAIASGLPPGARILDVGCGRGMLLRAMANRGHEAHGVENNSEATKGIDPRIHVRIENQLADVEYPPDYFDRVIIWHVLEHLPNPKETLQEAHRILKPGGDIIVAVPNYSSIQARWAGPAWFHLDLPRHLYHFPVSALKTLLENCGFTCRAEHHFSLRQNPFGWLQSILNQYDTLPKNSLYELLHRRGAGTGELLGFWGRFRLKTMFLLGMPFATIMAVIAALCRKGATVHVVATALPPVEETQS